jgi:ribosomal protein S18 acetylase RimI-like enzyme
VALSERGKGIGRALVDNAIEALRAEGINKVALVVIDGNIIGNEFWEHLGFTKRNDLVYRNKVITTLDMRATNT